MEISRKAWIVAGITTSLVVIVGALVYFDRRATKKTAPKSSRKLSQFNQNLVQLAELEYQRWNEKGKKHELSPEMSDTLVDYWRRGTGMNFSPSQMQTRSVQNKYPWSAAAISWLVKLAGAGDDFKYSASHSNYIIAAINNRKQNNANPFKAYRINELPIREGDIVCRTRAGSRATYDTIQAGMPTHCDVVTQIMDAHGVSIGGNVSQRFSKTNVPINKEGYITDRSYFAILRNTK